MKTFNTGSVLKSLVALWLMAGLLNTQLFAAGTDAGVTISNQASVTYQVNSVTQPTVVSDDDGNAANGLGTTDFLVDRLIAFSVTSTDGADVPVTAGQDVSTPGSFIPNPPSVLTFSVTHTGNSDTQDFDLSFEQGAADDFDPGDIAIFVESGANVGYQPLEDTATIIDELAEDASATVYVVGSVDIAQADGDLADIILIADARTGGAVGIGGVITPDTGTYDPDTVQNVFGDGAGTATGDVANDGSDSDTGRYIVNVPLVVAKTHIVASDPTGLADPKAIPGAEIRYTISITNNGTDPATSLSVSDTLPAELAYENDSGNSFVCSANGSTCTGCAAPSVTAGPGGDVTFSGITVAGSGGNCQITFDAIVQ